MTNPQAKADGKPVAKPARADVDDVAVAQYLAAHPDFFEQHATLLGALRLPHVRGDGTTVSLVERQVDVLRERSRELELRLRTLVDNGRANDTLAAKIHRLAVRLIHAHDLPGRIAAVEASLREDFGAREFVVVAVSTGTPHARALAGAEARFLRVVPADDAGLRSFESLFTAGRPRCGRVRDSQRDWLFPSADVEVGSVALVPLGAGGAVGLLAIASPDADHFNPTMSTDFLARIGELVAAALDAGAARA